MKPEAVFPNIGKSNLLFQTPAIGLNKEQCPIVRETGYSMPQFIFCVEGEGVLETEGKVFQLPAGTVFFLPEGREHRYYGKGKWVTSWISLAGVGLTPDVPVEVDDALYLEIYYGNVALEDDPQVQAAVAALKAN